MNFAATRVQWTATLLVVCVFWLGVVALTGQAMALGGDTTPAVAEDEPITTPEEEAFVVELDSEGDGDITVTTQTLDLEDGAAQTTTFDGLREDEEWQQDRVDSFEAIWSDTVEDVDRSMSVTDPAIEFETVDDTGAVRLSLTIEGLAETSDDELTVAEPLRMSETPWPLYIGLPDSHDGVDLDAEDDPDEQTDEYLKWEAGSDLSDLSLETALDDADDTNGDDDGAGDNDDEQTDETVDAGDETSDGEAGDDDADDTANGFGIGVALAALLGTLLLRRRR